jgi:cytochrome c oxidase cbb3-type subunit 3
MKMSSKDKREFDEISGMHTTGHEWDGIKELENPAPRWWLWVWFATFVWSVGYWVVYPTWPTISGEGERGGTVGTMEWTQYKQLAESQQDIVARKAKYLKKFNGASFEDIQQDKALYSFAVAGGKAAFKDNCATCHGTGGAGGNGYPNLNDDDWLWGGTTDAIYDTVKYGIRFTHDETRESEMPAFGDMLDITQIDEVANFVEGLSQGDAKVIAALKIVADNAEADEELDLSESEDLTIRGAAIFAENCTMCHGEKGTGVQEMGAPNLADSIWFYSEGDKASIVKQMKQPRHGVMPAWIDRLDDDTIRQLTVYVHSLGGGQ